MLTVLWFFVVSCGVFINIHDALNNERFNALDKLDHELHIGENVIGVAPDGRPLTFAELNPTEAAAREDRAQQDYEASLARINSPLYFLHLITPSAVLWVLLFAIIPTALLYALARAAVWIAHGFKSDPRSP